MHRDEQTSVERYVLALEQNSEEFNLKLSPAALQQLRDYYELLLKWNERLHLVGPCSPEEFATRHVLESLFLLRHLPPGARIVDVGPGGGLPMIPCLIVRADLRAILVESSHKKAVFLSEALRAVGVSHRATVVASRFEDIVIAPEGDYLTSRALDRFAETLPKLIEWARPHRTLLIYAGEELRREVETLLPASRAELIPQSERRFLIVCPTESRAIPGPG